MTQGRRRLVLVAGGAGFIGSHLCRALLASGADVVCLDNLQTGTRANLRAFEREPRFSFVEGDVVSTLPAVLRSASFKPALVMNLACPASPPHYQADPVRTMMTSVVGTDALLRLSERAGARFVQASTSEVYGDPAIHPQTESYWGNVNPIGPRACYDEGKRAAETLAFDYERAGRVDVRVARIFNTYGPNMQVDDGRVVSNVICQALSGADITLYGDGRQTRSFCYVSDLVDGLLRLGSHDGPAPGPVNLGNPNELSVADLVDKVVGLTGSASRIVRKPLPVDDPQRRRPDIARAEAVLGWSPKVSLEVGLKDTIAYFTRELSRPRVTNGAERESGRSVAV
ncbi:UDP-glucuronic acid decarboxylase family protein [uncultured Enterovirga sp.]|uniref:UDP-glucuronic acid decarboxylase family protein n=1 Tax=uncultured Enterovirga sp. TaxID=2026352 RepID=UPI0035C99CBA